MSFLSPFYFFAFIALIIPIIIHLINFRKPRRVAFSTLAFLHELQKTTIRRLNLKKLLLLALRLLALSMLAFALIRPFIPSGHVFFTGPSSQTRLVTFLIDNGPSMMQIDENGPYIDQAHRIAKEITRQSPEEARFLILPSHGEPGSIRWRNKEEALRYISEIEPVNKGAYPVERMQLIKERMKDEFGETGPLFWISDARETHLKKVEKVFSSFEDEKKERFTPVTFIRLGGHGFQNCAITSVKLSDQPLAKGLPATVSVRVENFGDQAAYHHYLSLKIEGERTGEYEFDLAPGQASEFLFEIIPQTEGYIQGKAIMEGGTYTFDQKRFFSVEIPDSRRILLIHDQEGASRASYLQPVLEAISESGPRIQASFTNLSQIRSYDIHTFDAVILEGLQRIPDYLKAELVHYIQQGRGLFFIPSHQGNIENYNRFLEKCNAGVFSGKRGNYGRADGIASFQPLQAGQLLIDDLFEYDETEDLRVDMPEIFHYWRYQPLKNSGTSLLRSNLGEPLFVEHSSGDGKILVATMGFDPGWSDLAVKPLYAPLLYHMMLYISSWEHGGMQEHVLGSPFDRYVTETTREVIMEKKGESIRPAITRTPQGLRIRYNGEEWEPGWLFLHLDDKKNILAVNQNISESDFTSLSLSEIEKLFTGSLPIAGFIEVSGFTPSELETALASASFGREIWAWFIGLALLFMIAESIISKKYKIEHARN